MPCLENVLVETPQLEHDASGWFDRLIGSLESFSLPLALDGSAGNNRTEPSRSHAEQLLLWAAFQKRKPMSSPNLVDIAEFMAPQLQQQTT